jgi:hypothetical protein
MYESEIYTKFLIEYFLSDSNLNFKHEKCKSYFETPYIMHSNEI